MKQVRNDLLVSTNSTILTKIIELKTDIDDQITLCSNVFKLDKVNEKDLTDLIESTTDKIDELKDLQLIIANRNAKETLEYNSRTYFAQELIKIKEGLLLKKKLKINLVGSAPEQDAAIYISLEAFQAVQRYKKELNEIQSILETFNNKKFNLQDYR